MTHLQLLCGFPCSSRAVCWPRRDRLQENGSQNGLLLHSVDFACLLTLQLLQTFEVSCGQNQRSQRMHHGSVAVLIQSQDQSVELKAIEGLICPHLVLLVGLSP
jgi:hypothetical protein